MQGHVVHVVGMGEGWGRELPGLVRVGGDGGGEEVEEGKMKIAWRYERLGEVGGTRGGSALVFLLLVFVMYISGMRYDRIVQSEFYM